MCQCQWLSNSSNNNKWQPIRWWTRQTWADISIYRQLVSIHHQIPLTILIDFVSKENYIYITRSLSLVWIEHFVLLLPINSPKMFLLECALMSFVITVLCSEFKPYIYIYVYQFIYSTCPDITTYRPNPTYFESLSLCLSLFNILKRFLIQLAMSFHFVHTGDNVLYTHLFTP